MHGAGELLDSALMVPVRILTVTIHNIKPDVGSIVSVGAIAPSLKLFIIPVERLPQVMIMVGDGVMPPVAAGPHVWLCNIAVGIHTIAPYGPGHVQNKNYLKISATRTPKAFVPIAPPRSAVRVAGFDRTSSTAAPRTSPASPALISSW